MFMRDPIGALPGTFVCLAIPIGLFFATLVPPLQVPDEMAHLVRAYSVSNGMCVPPPMEKLPAAIVELNTAFPPLLERRHPYRLSDYRYFTNKTGVNQEVMEIRNPAANLYHCAPYLAAAAGVEAARLGSQPPILLLYWARLGNLFFFVSVVYVALRILPVCRPVLFCLALMPMTLHQAASASADGPTIASAFLLFAYVLFLAVRPDITSISARQFMLLCGILLFATLCKFNVWMVLLVLLIPSRKFRGLGRQMLAVTFCVAIVTSGWAIWRVQDKTHMLYLPAAKAQQGVDVDRNVNFLLHHTGEYMAVVGRTLQSTKAEYATEFVGKLGWLSVALPFWLVCTYLATLTALALRSEGTLWVSFRSRFVCLAVVVGSVVSICVLLWTMEMREAAYSKLADVVQPGVQGRYFIPLAPIFCLLFANRRFRLNDTVTVAVCVILVLVSNYTAIAAVHRIYYWTPSKTLAQAGVYRRGVWVLDGNDARNPSSYGPAAVFGLPDDIPVAGDWDGSGVIRIGVFRPSNAMWYLDLNNNGKWDGASGDAEYQFGAPGDEPVVGDWNGAGTSKIGVFRRGAWFLDTNGNHVFDEGDRIFVYGRAGDVPVVSNWSGAGKADQIGVFRDGLWSVDSNGDGVYQTSDSQYRYGIAGDQPLVGNWDGAGRKRIGVFRNGAWFLNVSGSNSWGPQSDVLAVFGKAGDRAVVGHWTVPPN